MKEIYVFDDKLIPLGIIDDYTSLIWAKRYNEVGDCELYIGVNNKSLSIIKRGYYLQIPSDDMICRIKKIELTTDVENGDYLVVTGYDALDILDQRIIWNQLAFTGKVEDYIIRIIKDAFNMQQLEEDPPIRTQRQILNFKIANRTRNLKDGISEQVQYDNVGEKVRSLCKTYNYGCKVYRDDKNLMFDIYIGVDRSNRIIFSPEFDNLLSSDYKEDATDMSNVALVGGKEDEYTKKKITKTSNHASGIDRYEMYVDAGSTSNSCTWAELKILYPPKEAGGIGEIEIVSPTYIVYRLERLDVILVDNIQFNELKTTYTNGRVCYKKSDETYEVITPGDKTLDELKELYPDEILLFQIDNVIAANLTSAKVVSGNVVPPQDGDSVTLANVIYDDYLLNKGYEEIAKHGLLTSFEGSIDGEMTFKYKRDYNLGDIVLTQNEYGISAKARITEIIEVFDENGHSIEPKFEFQEVI